MSKILVTGGAGFIGSHLVKKLLEQKHEVVIVDNLNDYYDQKLKKDRLNIFLKGLPVTFYEADIRDLKALKKIFKDFKFDIICHLAAQAGVRYSLTNPWAYEQTNILGTINLLELAKDNGIKKFIFASSSSVYGLNEKQPFNENDSVDQPISLYAATKRAGELIAYNYHHLYRLPITILRFFTVFGPWGRPDMAYFKFTGLILKGKPIDLYNQGKMKRDFTYIDDIVGGIMSSVEKDFVYEIINLGNNRPAELMELVNLLEKYLGKVARKNYLPIEPGDVISTWADIAKAEKLLGFSPKTTLAEGIKKFVEWYVAYNP